MPVGHLIKTKSSIEENLIDRLTSEWLSPDQDAARQSPIIIEDTQGSQPFGGSNAVHLYVIWEAWANLSQRERSEVIMDSYEATHTSPDVLRVTLAMGLTEAEADKMKLKYTTGE